MKKLFAMAAVSAFLTLSAPARADHHAVFVHGVQKLSSTACAVELWISEDGQDAFEGVDRVTVEDVLLASLGDAVAADINAGGNTDVNDSILFASNSFQSETGLDADVSFPDAACAGFVANADFSFLLDDPDFGGPETTIDTLTASSSFGGDNTAMVKSSPGANPQFVDLDADFVIVANNAGDEADVGASGGGTGSDGSGGCSLIR